MYKVYGTFIFVPGLDLSTSGLELNTEPEFSFLAQLPYSFQSVISQTIENMKHKMWTKAETGSPSHLDSHGEVT